MPLKKIYCSKVTYNPEFREELVIEIPEKIFQVDGHDFIDFLIEGLLMFNVKFDDTNKVTEVYIENKRKKKSFEENFNSSIIYKKVEKYANEILTNVILTWGKREVQIPQSLRDKYFIDGRDVSFLA